MVALHVCQVWWILAYKIVSSTRHKSRRTLCQGRTVRACVHSVGMLCGYMPNSSFIVCCTQVIGRRLFLCLSVLSPRYVARKTSVVGRKKSSGWHRLGRKLNLPILIIHGRCRYIPVACFYDFTDIHVTLQCFALVRTSLSTIAAAVAAAAAIMKYLQYTSTSFDEVLLPKSSRNIYSEQLLPSYETVLYLLCLIIPPPRRLWFCPCMFVNVCFSAG